MYRHFIIVSLILSVVVGLVVGTAVYTSQKLPMPAMTVIEQSIAQNMSNVVHIRNNTQRWQGSGVLIAPDLVLTARHIVDDGDDFNIMINSGKIYKATRAISSKKYDLGFIKLNVKLPCTTLIGNLNQCRLGQTVYAIGSPYGDINFNSVTLGVISSLRRNLEKYGCPEGMGWSVTFQTDAAGHPGNSGCPIFTVDGIVRGILVGGFSNALVYCVPAELVSDDCALIQLMFALDQYSFEEQVFDPYYNYETDTEYY